MQIIPDRETLIECRCGHESIVILPGGVLLPEIKRRARCRACGQRDVVRATVMTPTENRPKLGGIVIEDDGTRRRYRPGELARPKIWPDV